MIASERLQELVSRPEAIAGLQTPAKMPATATTPLSQDPQNWRVPGTSAPENLILRIFSFSFHRNSVPKDESGHGGGFVFDARGLPNPGREERFKDLTGKDASVIDYLKQYPVVDKFLADATSMVESSVKNYQERGFKNLMVSFGCTGGQHRSVYLAEAMAEHFRSRPGVEVRLRHLQLEKLSQ
jgi:RNase adaptor protein for sRNA GlmZ degradation